jgi:Ribose/Galactose Isomerase
MRIAAGSDEANELTSALMFELHKRGPEVLLFGPLAQNDRDVDWPLVASHVAEAVVQGDSGDGFVCCRTGTGASIAATRRRASAPRWFTTQKRREARAFGVTPTCWRSACAPPPSPSCARFSTRGSRPRRAKGKRKANGPDADRARPAIGREIPSSGTPQDEREIEQWVRPHTNHAGLCRRALVQNIGNHTVAPTGHP